MIQIKHLSKAFGKLSVFDDTDFSFPGRGLICLLGASGSGKSTLFNLLAGFDRNYTGEITVRGTDIRQLSEADLCAYRREDVGFVFQNYHLLSGYTALDNVMLACELNAEGKEQNLRSAQNLLQTLGLGNKQNAKIEDLSGGQKQRVAIARALINNPSMVLADEPTGALDRSNASEMMSLLKEISKDRLVIVITHDKKVCEFADEIIQIKEGKILKTEPDKEEIVHKHELRPIAAGRSVKPNLRKLAFKNFSIRLMRYLAVSLAVSIGTLGFILSLSSGNIMNQAIADFKDKNSAFNNGYIKTEDMNTVFAMLQKDVRLENVYQQYILKDITLTMNGKSEVMAAKYPLPKATESMAFGHMPARGKNEIVVSPSLAKKFTGDLSKLIGQKLILTYNGKQYSQTVAGIFNAYYDDFFVSSDVEQALYEGINNEESYSISYDVINFEDIVQVSEDLRLENIESKNASKEVLALQNTFQGLKQLFLVVSCLILLICIGLSMLLLFKLQNARYKEVGLLAALGFHKKMIRKVILNEYACLSAAAVVLNGILIAALDLASRLYEIPVQISGIQIAASILSTVLMIIVMSMLASYRLIHTEPAQALRK